VARQLLLDGDMLRGMLGSTTGHVGRIFHDRRAGGAALARELERFRGEDVLVLGIPRGGMLVAQVVARVLGAELDFIVARKIGAPFQPELALGAIAADGSIYLNEELLDPLGALPLELTELAVDAAREAKDREARFRGDRAAPKIEGRTVILVDDGLATGSTMFAALRSLRGRGPKKLVVAVPVGAADTLSAIAAEADEVVCVARPQPFRAVGEHYQVFDQVSDKDVEGILRTDRRERGSR
jgi:putative phosphoribosyl transferase